MKVTAFVLITALVVLFIQHRKIARVESRAQELEEQLAAKDVKIRELRQGRVQRSSRLRDYLNDAQTRRDGNETMKLDLENQLNAKVEDLKAVMARLPEQAIPELKLATLSDWYVAADGKLETVEDYRRALGKIRSLAETRFAKLLQPALGDYLRANNNEFPSDTAQLRSFVGPEINDEMLRRYAIVPSKTLEEVKANGGAHVGGKWQITQASLVDPEYDTHSVIGAFGIGSYSFR